MERVRLQKFMAECGIGSRRKCEEIIRKGRVKVNGETAAELGMKIDAVKDEVRVDGKIVRRQGLVYFAFNKPKGVTSTCYDRYADRTVLDFIKSGERIYPVGRLDKDSRGLMLLTNDGSLAYELTHPKFGHEKEYLVETEKPIRDSELEKLRKGVRLEEGTAAAKRIERISADKFKIVLTQGWKRQIRRMAEAVGHKIVDLQRVRINKLELDGLKEGRFMEISASDISSDVSGNGSDNH